MLSPAAWARPMTAIRASARRWSCGRRSGSPSTGLRRGQRPDRGLEGGAALAGDPQQVLVQPGRDLLARRSATGRWRARSSVSSNSPSRPCAASRCSRSCRTVRASCRSPRVISASQTVSTASGRRCGLSSRISLSATWAVPTLTRPDDHRVPQDGVAGVAARLRDLRPAGTRRPRRTGGGGPRPTPARDSGGHCSAGSPRSSASIVTATSAPSPAADSSPERLHPLGELGTGGLPHHRRQRRRGLPGRAQPLHALRVAQPRRRPHAADTTGHH